MIILGGLFVKKQPKMYKAASTIILHSTQASGGGLSSFAALAGINLGQQGSKDISAYIPDILRTRSMMELILDKKWHADLISGDTAAHSLEYWWKAKPDTTFKDWKERHRDNLVERLRRVKKPYIKYTLTENKGLAILATEFEDPRLALEINKFLIEELDKFVADKTRTKSGRTRIFIESRLDEAHRLLLDSQSRLFAFRLRNLQREAPTIQMEEQRLQLNYTIQQEQYLALRKQYELARIEELKETEVLELLEPATLPRSPSNVSKAAFMTVICIASFIWSFLIVFLFDIVSSYWKHFRYMLKEEPKKSVGVGS
jgi:uncharacterized protein involved in exopolysaccharide biosynthesis